MRAGAVAIALAFALAGSAASHGDAEWIARGGYLDPQAMSCCGPVDCQLAPASLVVTPGRGGVTVDGVLLPWGRGAYHSIDGRVWWCRHLHPPIVGRARCVFIPPAPGS